jgi:ABC-2 type transport system permease protein
MAARSARYFRLLLAFARFGLMREFAFRANFLVKMFVEVLWLGILLAFYRTIFTKTSVVAEWQEAEYLFFVGCYFTLEGLIETLFLENCSGFADLVRTGDLDFYLLRPIDEQFLLTCRNIEWSSAPNVLMGGIVMGIALFQMNWAVNLWQALLFLTLFLCGTAMAYSFLLCLTSTSIWFVRNQSLYEMWWLFTSLVRYPKEIFTKSQWAGPIGQIFTYVIPILLVVNVPANVMAKTLFDPYLIGLMLGTTALLLFASRRFFQKSLRRYRSASS